MMKILILTFILLTGCSDFLKAEQNSMVKEQKNTLINASKYICSNKTNLDYIAFRELNNDISDYNLIYNEKLYNINDLNLKPYCSKTILNSYLKELNNQKTIIKKYNDRYFLLGNNYFQPSSISKITYNKKVPFKYLNNEFYSNIKINLNNGTVFNLKYKEQEEADQVFNVLVK